MSVQVSKTIIPKVKLTREDALVWARGLVSKGIRVVRLRSGKTRRADRTALVAPWKAQR